MHLDSRRYWHYICHSWESFSRKHNSQFLVWRALGNPHTCQKLSRFITKYEKFIRRLSITLSSDKQANSWWRHQMETFSALLAILQYPVISPHKGQWRGALMFYLICAWMHDWVNNREARDLRCYRAHYDVIVMHLIQMSVDIIGSTVEPAGDK